jgi:phosphoenolpyruvate---glycerone phosphotransferase subunit DhaM
MSENGFVGLVIVSHSASLAQGLAELVSQVAGADVAIEAVGGGPDDRLGTDGARVLEAMRRGSRGAGSVVLMDLGSSVLAVKAALGELQDDERDRIRVADAPLVEGAVAAGVIASTGEDADGVLRAAEEARNAGKL